MKTRMGEKVRIFTAGADWEPKYYGLTGIVENLGVLSINETAELYRRCDAGVVLMFTRHPSYLPLELMASGCPVVTNFNPSTTWLLHDKENCFLTSASADCLCDTLVEILSDEHERTRVSQNALNTILNLNWDREIEKIYQYMRNPEM